MLVAAEETKQLIVVHIGPEKFLSRHQSQYPAGCRVIRSKPLDHLANRCLAPVSFTYFKAKQTINKVGNFFLLQLFLSSNCSKHNF